MHLFYLFQLTMANVEITVLNDNDHNPEFEKESYVFSDVWYEENGLVGMVKVRHQSQCIDNQDSTHKTEIDIATLKAS